MESAKFPVGAVIDDYLYTVTLKEHILEKISTKTYEVEYITDFGEYVEKGRKTLNLIKKNGEYIYLFEYDGRRAIQLDVKMKKSKIFKISQDGNGGYISAEFYDNKIYLLPKDNNCITVIDIEKDKIYESEQIFQNNEWNENNIEGMSPKVCSCSYLKDTKIYIFSNMTNMVKIYDVEKNSVENKKLTVLQGGVISLQIYNKKCYILDTEGKLWQFNDETNELDFLVDAEGKGTYFVNFIVTDKNIVFLPLFGEKIKIYQDNKLEIYNKYPYDIMFEKYKGHSKFYGYCDDEDNYYVAMHSANYLLVIEKHTGQCKWIKVTEDYQKYLQYHSGVISEKMVSLKEYIAHEIER